MVTINPAGSSGSTSGWARSRWARTRISRSSALTRFAPTRACEMTLVDGQVIFDRSKDVAARQGVPATLGEVRDERPAVARLVLAGGRARCPARAPAADAPLVITGARVVTVSGPGHRERHGGHPERPDRRRRARRHRAGGRDASSTGRGRPSTPASSTAHLSASRRSQASPAPSTRTRSGDINPHAKSLGGAAPRQRALPVARAFGITTVLTAPAGGLVSGQSALVRLAGTHAAMVVERRRRSTSSTRAAGPRSTWRASSTSRS